MPTLIDNTKTSPTTTNKFTESIPTLQWAFDSTSLGLLQECARKYYYQIILGFQPRGTSIHLSFGIAYHGAHEQFEHNRALGMDYDENLRTVIKWIFANFQDGPDPDSYKNQKTLLRSFVWYREQFRNDHLQTVILGNDKPAVELSFRFGLDTETPDGTDFIYCGHMDRLAQDPDGEYFWTDHKTTKSALDDRYFDGFSPSTQMTGYFAASQVVLPKPARAGLIEAAQLLVGGTRFGRRAINRTQGQLSEWYSNIQWWMHQAQRFAEENFWPMNEKACNNFGGCAFRQVCGRDPAVRDHFLKASYEKWDWNPLIIRGDV